MSFAAFLFETKLSPAMTTWVVTSYDNLVSWNGSVVTTIASLKTTLLSCLYDDKIIIGKH